MTRHSAKLLEMLWYTSMGLFLGLNAGTILAVVETFDSSRKIDATPGLMPYADARFAETHNEVVAGFIAQNMFKNGGAVALVLLAIALLCRIAYPALAHLSRSATTGSLNLSRMRLVLFVVVVGLIGVGANQMQFMNRTWPHLYDKETREVLDARREAFDTAHQKSERAVGGAWFAGAFALVISPWCRRIADAPLQSGDGEKESD